MHKKLLNIWISIFILLSSITFSQPVEFYPNDPNTWTENNIVQATPENLIQFPEQAIEFWSVIDDSIKNRVFELNFDAFKSKADEYFSSKIGIGISGFQDTSEATFSNGVVKNGNVELDLDDFPEKTIRIIALAGGGFKFILEEDKEINILDGSIDEDNILDDGTLIDIASLLIKIFLKPQTQFLAFL